MRAASLRTSPSSAHKPFSARWRSTAARRPAQPPERALGCRQPPSAKPAPPTEARACVCSGSSGSAAAARPPSQRHRRRLGERAQGGGRGAGAPADPPRPSQCRWSCGWLGRAALRQAGHTGSAHSGRDTTPAPRQGPPASPYLYIIPAVASGRRLCRLSPLARLATDPTQPWQRSAPRRWAPAGCPGARPWRPRPC